MKVKPIAEDHGELHEFTVTLWKDRVKVENEIVPLGTYTTQILNMDAEVFQQLHNLCARMLDILRRNFFDPRQPKDYFLMVETQKSVNAVLEEIRKLPVYQTLNINEGNTFRLLPRMYQNREAFEKSVKPYSVENNLMRDYYSKLAAIPDGLIVFQRYLTALLDVYFEGLGKRNPEYYAVGVYQFLADETAQKMLEQSFPGWDVSPYLSFRTAQDAMIEYTPMPNPDHVEEYVVAERLVFHSLAAFLYTDFYRGLMHGNVPRRCQNCGRYFLLENGYQTRYCNELAPGETEHTCRQVGPHRKESQAVGKTPAQIEYDRVYNRLKSRKNRGKISKDEWNEQVACAQDIKDRAERGELSDRDMRELFEKM